VNGHYISARQRAALNLRVNAMEETQMATCTFVVVANEALERSTFGRIGRHRDADVAQLKPTREERSEPM